MCLLTFSDQPSSLSTNDSSLPWQQPVGLSSPSSSTSARRLEWDSGADVGYLNMDMSKDKLSTIERVTLQGLAREGQIAKKVGKIIFFVPLPFFEAKKLFCSVTLYFIK